MYAAVMESENQRMLHVEDWQKMTKDMCIK